MDRYLLPQLQRDAKKKIVILTGPRQVGKTTLAKSLFRDFQYYNYDLVQDRKLIHQDQVNFNVKPVILDELHKLKNWKRWLKGHYDTQTQNKPIIVTGSAQLDAYKKMGDSLAGRYYQFRLMPLDVKELTSIAKISADDALARLLELSGFPEPCLSENLREYNRWKASHLDVILKQDILEMESLKRIRSVELLFELMTERVGSLVSYNSLREDLNTDDKSIKRWFNALENAYVLFKVPPYSKRLNRIITKAPKYYFFDVPRVLDHGRRFENLVALSLYKEILYRKDVLGEDYSLHFLRDVTHHEVDFLICRKKMPIMMLECKLSDRNHDNSFAIFEKALGPLQKIVLIKNLDHDRTLKDGTQLANAAAWLEKMEF